MGAVFERWAVAASDDPNARDKDGDEANEFQALRQDVAAAVADRSNDIQNFLKNHEDVYVRRGYYRAGRFPDAVELQASDPRKRGHRVILVAGIVLTKWRNAVLSPFGLAA